MIGSQGTEAMQRPGGGAAGRAEGTKWGGSGEAARGEAACQVCLGSFRTWPSWPQGVHEGELGPCTLWGAPAAQ